MSTSSSVLGAYHISGSTPANHCGAPDKSSKDGTHLSVPDAYHIFGDTPTNHCGVPDKSPKDGTHLSVPDVYHIFGDTPTNHCGVPDKSPKDGTHLSEPSPPQVNLSIIIVSWNVWPLLRACLQSIAQVTAPCRYDQIRTYGPANAYHVEVIVVDNVSSDETRIELPALFPWVKLIESSRNLGFTGGNNVGYHCSRGDYIFFLNPDTELIMVEDETDNSTQGAAVDPLTTMHELLQAETAVGMVGPHLRYGDGSWQNNRRRFPTHLTGFFESTWLGQFWPANPWIAHMHMADISAKRQHDVDWLNGSAMFCRRSALEEIRLAEGNGQYIGPFDEQFFMYSEELDLCRRLKVAGWQLFYTPDARIIHYEGRSSAQIITRRHILFNTSKVRYYRKYFGRTWATLLRFYLLFEYAIQIVLEGGKMLLGHKRAMRRARIQGYLAILRNGLRITESIHV